MDLDLINIGHGVYIREAQLLRACQTFFNRKKVGDEMKTVELKEFLWKLYGGTWQNISNWVTKTVYVPLEDMDYISKPNQHKLRILKQPKIL